MGIITQAWSWIPWVLGLGTIGWIALALLAPGVLSIISPILRGVAEGLVEFAKILYSGIVDILDSWKTVVTVIFILWLWTNYSTFKDSYKEAPKAQVKKVTQPVAPKKQTKEKPAFSLDGWEWFHK